MQGRLDFFPADAGAPIPQPSSGVVPDQWPGAWRGRGLDGQPILKTAETDGTDPWPNPRVRPFDAVHPKHMAGSTRRDDVQEAHLEAQNAKPNDLTAEPMLGSKRGTPICMCVGHVVAFPRMVLGHLEHSSEPSACRLGVHFLLLRDQTRILPCEDHFSTPAHAGPATRHRPCELSVTRVGEMDGFASHGSKGRSAEGHQP